MRTILIGLAALSLTTLPVQAQEIPDDAPALAMRSTVPLPPRRMQGGTVYAIVTQAAARHGVPARLAHAVIHVESRHNCRARNRSGASGLGQLMPGTARAMGVRNSLDCAQNADGAMAYLGRMYRAAGGNWCLAATGYNRGSVGGCSGYGRKVVRSAGA